MKIVVSVLMAVCLAACAGLQPRLEQPQVKLMSIKPLTADGFQHRFVVGLRVTNPNATDIVLQGMSYQIGILGHDIFSGVASNVPVLRAYEETPLTVEVSASLVDVLSLISELTRERPQTLTYSLKAKLDVGTFMPAIRIEESGPLPFSQVRGLSAQ
ncbi:LEA type 2 family protein [Simiduia aestuariiviva]|uniref:LEA14-like dessication related protein n=1 Tax=Simiduia aestuariiviva TaxID=1510459 RepID=A0A839UW18_9GAMM|nr:LEA type 2 family protein [Simiduia aestuariiviva]MBB3169658.1 LEA14-like dessication related protein [Simiduia aestuariiviva]